MSYWMKLKETLSDVRVDVIMDWIREAQQKKSGKRNTWLSYGLPVHRLRGESERESETVTKKSHDSIKNQLETY